MLTQFQRAMRELSIEPIVAYSPQAKGRIENLFKTLQDRLIKELRLKNISDIKTANQFLKKEFIPWFNQKYGKEPAKKANLHRKLSHQEKKQLLSIFSRYSQRVIQNDFTIRFNNKWHQLTKEQPVTIRPKDRVLIEERLNGSLWIRLRGKYLNYQVLLTKPSRQQKQPWIIPASQKKKKKRKKWKPSKDHPWRKPFITKKPDISISFSHKIRLLVDFLICYIILLTKMLRQQFFNNLNCRESNPRSSIFCFNNSDKGRGFQI